MVDSTYPPGAVAWKGSAVRRLKSYASWVQYGVSQYRSYLLKRTESFSDLGLVRKDHSGGFYDVSIVYLIYIYIFIDLLLLDNLSISL